ncbi:type A chloramphenicol O-acetyltransferase [Paenibacillus allorhizosphaerae]|uniref:Chloramphenicol acetyltransferase n=1 Tax=Paenibacillus allorhizosphaerae TaxID=2849866 RepID=A0ABM8VP69_9BACL|nr:type A chloramphenicol O-acetyltransferase [Paenibacillus allorhizosphaerae]CAG7652226.1 Chloramphenicol acetyltransferase [Paenibacillus allorhizosphaerae]
MKFHPIDVNSWGRKPYFEHYLNNVRCTYSMTANVDITLLLAVLKNKGVKLYPAMIHMITTVVNRHREFRTCFNAEGRLGYWDNMSPSFTIFHDENKTFSTVWTPFCDEFDAFYTRYIADLEMYGNVMQFAAKTNEPPNSFPISCIPWVSFTGFNLNVYAEGTYLLPIFTIGKYVKQDNQIQLPLSVQLHHAVCDGYHAGVMFQELQQRADQCEEWL